MTTRVLIYEDGNLRRYELRDAGGRLFGYDEEAKLPAEEVTRSSITDALVSSLIDNRAFIALTPPTNAQLVTQVKQLCAQNNRLIRLLLGMLDGTN